MKIVLVSDYSGFTDEGTRKTAFHLQKGLSRKHEVLHLRVRDIVSVGFWRQLRTFNPHIIHFMPGPTIKCFAIVRALKISCLKAKTIMSALHPALFSPLQELVRILRPDLVLVQSFKTERLLRSLGCRTYALPGGVDVERFIPTQDKEGLRKKYGLDVKEHVVLHVGSLNRQRNLLILNRIANESNVRVIIIGNLSIPYEPRVVQALVKGGCTVIRRYIRCIEEMYALSDCYVFPVFNSEGSIEFPLSVTEAMACNLPVVSTKFGALPRFLEFGAGLYYAKDEQEFVHLVQRALNEREEIRTRMKVLPYSWERVIERLERIYDGLVAGELYPIPDMLSRD